LLSVALPDGRLIEYAHDPLGRRIAKKIDGLIAEKYLWQGMTTLLAVYNGNSLRMVVDASGNVVKMVEYDSFGNIITDTNAGFSMPFGFAGGLHDRDTGLIRFGARDYDPDVGRWCAKDPILFAGGDTDLWGYCVGDPLNWVDPWGLIIGSIGAKVIGGIVRASSEGTLIAGKIGDSLVSLGIAGGAFHQVFADAIGTGAEALQVFGGVQTASLAGIIAIYSSAPIAVPIGLSLLGGAEIGLGINSLYERISGQAFGADLYDWLHPTMEDNPCK